METLYSHKDSNIRKTWLLMAIFISILIGVGWFLSYLSASPAVLYLSVVISLLMSVGSYWFSDKLVIAMTHAKPVTKEDAVELYRIVENLSITAGLPVPKIYVMDDAALNAFATGRNPEHGVVAVTRGLLNRLDRTELEGVIAHELSHIGNRDMLVSTVMVVLAGSIVMVSDLMTRHMLWSGGSSGRRDSRDGGAHGVILAIGIAAMLIAPLFATLIRLAISRKREFLADASGALLTRYPEGLANALEKISSDPNQMRSANNATAHLFFENPFKADKRGGKTPWLAKIFMTHPPVEERIKALRGVS